MQSRDHQPPRHRGRHGRRRRVRGRGAPRRPRRARGAGRAARLGRGARSFKALALDPRRRQALADRGPRRARGVHGERARVAAAARRERARELSTRMLCWEVPPRATDRRERRGRGGARRGNDPRRLPLRAAQVHAGGAAPDATPSPSTREPDRRRRGEPIERRSPAAALVAAAVNAARDLQNRPANDLTPTALGEYARGARRGDRRAVGRGRGTRGHRGARHGRLRRRGAGLRAGAGADHAQIRGRRTRAGSDAGLRRQGRHLRQRRHLAEARRENGGDEVRHVRRRRGPGGGRGDREPAAAGEAARGRRRDREPAERPRGQARRHRHRGQRQDDRGQQHRRRGPAGARRLPVPRRLARAPSGSSTWRRSPAR